MGSSPVHSIGQQPHSSLAHQSAQPLAARPMRTQLQPSTLSHIDVTRQAPRNLVPVVFPTYEDSKVRNACTNTNSSHQSYFTAAEAAAASDINKQQECAQAFLQFLGSKEFLSHAMMKDSNFPTGRTDTISNFSNPSSTKALNIENGEITSEFPKVNSSDGHKRSPTASKEVDKRIHSPVWPKGGVGMNEVTGHEPLSSPLRFRLPAVIITSPPNNPNAIPDGQG